VRHVTSCTAWASSKTEAGGIIERAGDSGAANQFGLSPELLVGVLSAGAALLLLGSVILQTAKYFFGYSRVGLIQLLYVDEEFNIPASYAVLLLLIAVLLLAAITAVLRDRGDSSASHWMALTLMFLLMAADEGLSFHEQLVVPMRGLLGAGNLGVLYFAWVVPGIVVVGLVVAAFMGFVTRLPARTRRLFVCAAGLYVLGALGMELVAGPYAEINGNATFAYSMMATLEEALEMAGVLLFVYALLGFIAASFGEILVRFAPGRATEQDPR